MVRSVHRMCAGVLRLIQKDDREYFTGGLYGLGSHSHFRQDLRAIVGGALAVGFIAAAFAQIVDFPYEGIFTLVASAIGGVSAKYLLV